MSPSIKNQVNKLIAITILVIVSLSALSISANAEGLNKDAQLLKTEFADKYSQVKLFAEQNWKGDHEMMVYIINKQSTAFIEIVSIIKGNPDMQIMSKALKKWGTWNSNNELLYQDYAMVLYTYKKQLNAKGAY